MRLFFGSALVMLVACSTSGNNDQPPNEQTQQALFIERDSRTIIVSQRDSQTDLSRILAAQETGYWWVRIDLPQSAALGTPHDLASSTTPGVSIAQSYLDSCNPADAFSDELCWLVEEYTAGEPGLEGGVVVQVGEGVQGGFEFHWEGETDRFEGPPQRLIRWSDGRFDVAADNVVELD